MAVKNKQSPTLIKLIKQFKCKKIIELGVWKGHTTRNILRALGDSIESYWAVDHWIDAGPGRGRQSGLSEEDWNKMHRRLCVDMLWFPNLKILRMKTLEAVTLFPKGFFDFGFIDADHSYEAAKADIEALLPLMSKEGVLTGHDYFRRGDGVKQAVNEIFGKENITLVRKADLWIYLMNGKKWEST